jgi:hypothetical protein
MEDFDPNSYLESKMTTEVVEGPSIPKEIMEDVDSKSKKEKKRFAEVAMRDILKASIHVQVTATVRF